MVWRVTLDSDYDRWKPSRTGIIQQSPYELERHPALPRRESGRGGTGLTPSGAALQFIDRFIFALKIADKMVGVELFSCEAQGEVMRRVAFAVPVYIFLKPAP